MAHQYKPKIFHGLHKNPPPRPLPPSYILNVRSLTQLTSNQVRKQLTWIGKILSMTHKYIVIIVKKESNEALLFTFLLAWEYSTKDLLEQQKWHWRYTLAWWALHVTQTQLQTIITQVKGAVYSRLLAYVDNDLENQTITPIYFLSLSTKKWNSNTHKWR